MMAIWRKGFLFKYDGILGTIEDTINNCMYFLTYEQTKQCCQSNKNLDRIISDIQGDILWK